MGSIAAYDMGCLAGERASKTTRIFEAFGAHAFDIDALLVILFRAGFPMAKNLGLSLLHRAESLHYPFTGILQDEAAMADLDIELGCDLPQTW